ncbi:DUF1801 domain-containing protein [Ideonella sp. YS5]|uniref:DUF1801 domain-containing protein n=1 Tax=Ideonella sp. YS5 TaxID=3453714 RepID=UPI003EEB18E3
MQKSPPAANPEAYLAALSGWHRLYVAALRSAVFEAAPLQESVKWGNLVFHSNGPVLVIRSEPKRVLFGFWRGQRMRHIEPRLKPGGKHEMATLELVEKTPLERSTVVRLVQEAVALNVALGDPTSLSTRRPRVRPNPSVKGTGLRPATYVER